MTIEEWNSQRIGFADGRVLAGTYVYRLEYSRRDHWTQTLIADEVPGHEVGPPREKPIACRDGVYGWIESSGEFTETSRDPAFCNGVGRWIHYDIARNWVWKKEIGDGVITYTDPGERVVFDAKNRAAARIRGRKGRWLRWLSDRVSTRALALRMNRGERPAGLMA